MARDPKREAKGTSKGGQFAVDPNPKGKTVPKAKNPSPLNTTIDKTTEDSAVEKAGVDYLKVLLSKHLYSDIEKLISSKLWSEAQSVPF